MVRVRAVDTASILINRLTPAYLFRESTNCISQTKTKRTMHFCSIVLMSLIVMMLISGSVLAGLSTNSHPIKNISFPSAMAILDDDPKTSKGVGVGVGPCNNPNIESQFCQRVTEAPDPAATPCSITAARCNTIPNDISSQI